MCDDPTCEACTIKNKVDAQAEPLAHAMLKAIKADTEAGQIDQDIYPRVLLRACAGIMASICVKAGDHRQDALLRAMSDLGELYNEMTGGDEVTVINHVTETVKGVPIMPNRSNLVH